MDYWIINECKSSTAVGGITPGTELARVCFQEKAGLLGRGWRWRGPCVAWRAHERREISVSFFTLHVQPVHTGSGSREPASNPGEKQRGKARRPHRIASQAAAAASTLALPMPTRARPHAAPWTDGSLARDAVAHVTLPPFCCCCCYQHTYRGLARGSGSSLS
jgi:hypothetical protein